MTKQQEFKSKAAVYRWLADNGREISEAQFYNHCADGLLRKKRGEKVYTIRAVQKYAKLHTKSAKTGEKDQDKYDKMREEREENELEASRIKLEERRHTLEVKRGKVVSKEDHESAIVGRVVSFSAQLSHMVQKNVPDWIDLVGGDQAKAPALMEAMQIEIDQRLGAFAADTEFEVFLEADA